MKIRFHKPYTPKNIDDILPNSVQNGWLTSGPVVKKFEMELCKLLNSKNVIAVNSCTAALHLALAAKKFNPGDKFIVPTYTFIASIEVGEYLGMEPILVDCEEGSLNMDLDKVENLLMNVEGIVAIIPVHFGGLSVDMMRLKYFADKYKVFILEDAAHAIETYSTESKTGDTNDAAAFSFYANKNITSGGEGGALSTNDDDFAKIVRKLSLHGMSKSGWNRYSYGGEWKYDVSELGYKYNMTDISASLGLNQLNQITQWQSRRLEIVKFYKKGLKNINGIITPSIPVLGVHAWHLYIIKIKTGKWKIGRDAIINKLNDRGIGTSVHYLPVHMHSYYSKKYGWKPKDFPRAYESSKKVISLPIYPLLKNAEVKYIVDNIKNLWLKHKS